MKKQIKTIIGPDLKFKLICGEETQEDLIEAIEDEDQLSQEITLRLNSKEGNSVAASLRMKEAFDCCGKFYLYNFTSTEKDLKETIEKMLKIAVLIGTTAGYTYIGYIHTEDHPSIEIGKTLGFKPLLSFVNNRSGNTLVEMYQLF